MLRSTKIVATLGPASQRSRRARAHDPRRRRRRAAQLLARHRRRSPRARRAGARDRRKVGRTVAIMCDLQGPKIRVGKFKDGKVTLETGAALHPRRRHARSATATRVGLDYKELPRDVEPGAVLLLDDGQIVLDVDRRARRRSAHQGAPRRRAVEQQGHQPPGRRPHRARADRQGHGRHQDRGEAQGRLPRGVVPEERRRHVHGARADARRRRQGAADRQDRARRGDRAALRRHHRRRPTASWWRAATSRWRSATPRCRRCRSG